MSKQTEALKLALEALELANYYVADYCNGNTIEEIDDAITAIREALAEQPAQQQKPVAVTYKEVWGAMNALYAGDIKQVQIALEMENKKLYTSPPTSKPLTDKAKAVIDSARAAMDDSVEAYDSEGSIKISSHLAASLSLCLDEYDRSALAEYPAQHQEAVAWMYQCSADSSGPVLMQHKRDWAESGSGLWTETPLYTSPPAQQQESCGWRMRHNGVWAYSFTKDAWDFIYAVSPAARKAARDNAPASKPWVGLTEQERTDICEGYGANIHWRAFRAIEDKLREKNA